MKFNKKWLALGLFTSVIAFGCSDEEMPAPDSDLATTSHALTGYCSVTVSGKTVPMETDYIPHVVACENGAASYEALKAQAVAARTYAYRHFLNTGKTIVGDGQDFQVYTCSNKPSQKHFQAAQDTQGIIISHKSNILTAFYVAGAIPSNKSTCIYKSGDSDPTKTQKHVTYNWGKSGSNVSGSNLGYLSNPTNRGCMSQNGAACLSNAGWKYRDILKFFYGDDITFLQATGSCIGSVSDDGKNENDIKEEEETGSKPAACDPQTVQNPSSTFKDMDASHWGLQYANALYNEGITKGCNDNPLYFCAECELPREQAVTFLFRALKLSEVQSSTPSFTDVPKNYSHNGSTYGQIEAAAKAGIINGCSPQNFCPLNKLTRAEAATLFVRALNINTDEYMKKAKKSFSDVSSTEWYYPYIQAAVAACLIDGYTDGTFKPANPIKRIEFAKLLAIAFKLVPGLCLDDAVECSDTKPCKTGTCNSQHVCIECTQNTCSGSQTLKVCADGKYSTQSCDYGCYNNKCGVCTDGQKTCEDKQPMICSGGEYINNGSPCSKICKAGVCIECESDSDCGANASCQSGSCVFSTPVCTPGDKSCDGNNVKTCNPDGKGYTSSPCNGTCTGKGICQETTQQECTPNALRCNGKTLESCNASGKWESKTVCAVMCSNNACIDCIDGSKKCSDDGKKVLQCTNGSFAEYSACNAGQKCDAGNCIDSSKPQTCNNDQLRCNNNTLEKCTNNSWVTDKQCPLMCANNKCIECIGTETRCGTSNNILKCMDGVFQSSACGAMETCMDGICQKQPDKPSQECIKDSECSSDQICSNGKCVAGNADVECTANADCSDNKICMDAHCVPDSTPVDESECKTDSECDLNMICQNNVCIPKPNTPAAECKKDKDCDADSVCRNNTCISKCTKAKDCSDSEVCYNEICTPKCKKDKDCNDGEICGDESVCIKKDNSSQCTEDTDCSKDEICNDGTCENKEIGVYSDSNCSQNNTRRNAPGFLALLLLPLVALIRRRKFNV